MRKSIRKKMNNSKKKQEEKKGVNRYVERLHSFHGSAVLLMSYYNQFVLLVQDHVNKKWSLPKGKFEQSKDFSFTTTAIRETYEETGLIYNYDYFLSGYLHKELDYMVYTAYSMVPVMRKTSNIEENVSKIKWFNSQEVNELLKKKECNLLTFLVLQKTVLCK